MFLFIRVTRKSMAYALNPTANKFLCYRVYYILSFNLSFNVTTQVQVVL